LTRRGRMPYSEIFGALRAINYQGALVMEPFLVAGGDVGRDISVFRDLLGSDDLDEEARTKPFLDRHSVLREIRQC
jgi:D-psicose/D-tagatose/L-ribulose 3-epimerase